MLRKEEDPKLRTKHANCRRARVTVVITQVSERKSCVVHQFNNARGTRAATTGACLLCCAAILGSYAVTFLFFVSEPIAEQYCRR
uniref:Col_cuticle_N domain-containing protein n=1 Tax=Panagrellus redivivus TaxID=6233 RepID=A0A7E4ZRU6_PANRE